MPPKAVNSPQPGKKNEDVIDLLELFYALLGKWREIAAATVACALIAAIGVLFFVTPKYRRRPPFTSSAGKTRPSTSPTCRSARL